MSNYADAAYADSYFSTRLRTAAWDDATADEQERALTMATRTLNQLNFLGEKADEEQENQFPRGDDTVVPSAIKQAACEIALAFLDGVDPDKEYENLFKTSNAYGGVRTTFDGNAVPEYFAAGVPSLSAWKLILPFLRDPRVLKLRRVD